MSIKGQHFEETEIAIWWYFHKLVWSDMDYCLAVTISCRTMVGSCGQGWTSPASLAGSLGSREVGVGHSSLLIGWGQWAGVQLRIACCQAVTRGLVSSGVPHISALLTACLGRGFSTIKSPGCGTSIDPNTARFPTQTLLYNPLHANTTMGCTKCSHRKSQGYHTSWEGWKKKTNRTVKRLQELNMASTTA